jgi:CO/xanthine dehydrogenase FAD-binding subunit
VKLPRFEYRCAGSVEEAVAALAAAGGEAKLLAGGQSLLAAMSFRLVRPSLLVDVDRLSGLDAIEASAEGLQVGALTRHAALERASLPGAWGVLGEAAAHIGHLPIRVRGTLGGSIAHADPAAELAVAATALEAEVVTLAPSGGRRIPVHELFLAPYSTTLEPAEMIVALWFPARPAAAAAAFEEFTERAGDFALASVCTVVERAEGLVVRARIALGSVGATPLRARPAPRRGRSQTTTPGSRWR